MNKLTSRLVYVFVGLALGSVLATGCNRPAAKLEITSYKDPYFPETYDLRLAECAYYVDPGGDYHILGRAVNDADDGDGNSIEQLLHVHLYWKPRPGKTFDNPTSSDATIRYAIVTDQGTAYYRGTGFIYPRKRMLGDTIVAKLEESRLGFQARGGDTPEIIGDARLAGKLVATDDPSLALDLRRRLDLCAGEAGE